MTRTQRSMTAPCDGCAFTEGAEANLEVWNNLKSQLCVLGGLPFVCHHDRDWRNTKQMRIEEAYADGWMICAGWKREVRALAALGGFAQKPPDLGHFLCRCDFCTKSRHDVKLKH